MSRRHRLRSRRDFERVMRRGASVARPEFVLYHAARAGCGCPRFGFVVSRRIGGAVSRNRVRRLLREAVRALTAELTSPVDVVVVARRAVLGKRLDELQRALAASAGRAGLTASGR